MNAKEEIEKIRKNMISERFFLDEEGGIVIKLDKLNSSIDRIIEIKNREFRKILVGIPLPDEAYMEGSHRKYEYGMDLMRWKQAQLKRIKDNKGLSK
jgi:hypothetical protein